MLSASYQEIVLEIEADRIIKCISLVLVLAFLVNSTFQISYCRVNIAKLASFNKFFKEVMNGHV